ncbi:NAD(P)-binding protein [Trichoderma novae-zelandiae]
MPSVPPGGLILVTGANGYIASVAVQVFLQRGYHTYGVAHMVMGMDMDMDPHNHAIIDKTIKESSVKSLVITSSLAACTLLTAGLPYKIDANHGMAKETLVGTGLCYMEASKARGEKKVFAWVREHKPTFSFNTVVPNVNFGTVMSPGNLGYRSTSAAIGAAVDGYPAAPVIPPPQWYIDVEDTALLQLGALTLDDVSSQRLLAFAEKRFPQQIKLESVEETACDAGEVENKRSIEALKKLGQPGFTSLEDTLAKNVPKTRIDLHYESLASATARKK